MWEARLQSWLMVLCKKNYTSSCERNFQMFNSLNLAKTNTSYLKQTCTNTWKFCGFNYILCNVKGCYFILNEDNPVILFIFKLFDSSNLAKTKPSYLKHSPILKSFVGLIIFVSFLMPGDVISFWMKSFLFIFKLFEFGWTTCLSKWKEIIVSCYS